MTNSFSNEALVPNWTVATEILKGDLMGHEFHGNQYLSLGSQVGELGRLKFFGDKASSREARDLHLGAAKNHLAEGRRHGDKSRELFASAEKTTSAAERQASIREGEAHANAGSAHLDAFEAHFQAGNDNEQHAKGEVDGPQISQNSTDRAVKASDFAQEMSDIASGKIEAPSPREYYLADEGMGGTRP